MNEGASSAPRVISLIGYRCTGKTTVGQLLAKKLNWPFADADDWVRESTQKEIAQIFTEEGEEAFRDLEQQAIATLSKAAPLVLSVGGGAVMRPANAAALSDAGPVVWLVASTAEIVRRLQGDPTTQRQRPPLTGTNVTEEVAEVLASRESTYRQYATHIVDTEGKMPVEVMEEVFRAVSDERLSKD